MKSKKTDITKEDEDPKFILVRARVYLDIHPELYDALEKLPERFRHKKTIELASRSCLSLPPKQMNADTSDIDQIDKDDSTNNGDEDIFKKMVQID